MMMFKKYPSIENNYQEKWINQFCDKFGNALTQSKYIITEKIHGANIQLIFVPNDPEYRIASRQQLTDRNFYNVGEVLDKMDLSWLHDIANKHESIIRVYGEVFGPGIQKGVNYGNEKRLLFFDMRIGEYLCTQERFFEYFKDAKELTVPVVGMVNSLAEALAFDTQFNSVLNDIEDNECEGIVIKPFKDVFHNNAGALFYIKKKNTKFAEKEKRKPRKPRPEWSDEVNTLRELFLAYLNEERLESVFSKEGRITDRKDIGRYIGYMMKDATDTFKKEENLDELELTKEELKYIMSVDRKVSQWIINEVT